MRFIDPDLYTYNLPQDRIALFPAEKRDEARLLFYHKGKITHHVFGGIASLLPNDSMLVFNDTRVIPARLYFRKPNGVLIEIFLLQPVRPSGIFAEAMNARGETVWECMIGNLKRWRGHQALSMTIELNAKTIELTAFLEDPAKNLVKFRWEDSDISFSEIIRISGKVPLPPYIHREAVEDDKVRYQTIYSKTEGAVASSTAGLHFTGGTMDDLKKAGIRLDFITLHIGAGTFQPIKTKNAVDHEMHSEQIIVSKENIDNLIGHRGPVIAAGTTAMRTLESLYWYGANILAGKKEFRINKLDPYSQDSASLPSVEESLKTIRNLFSESDTPFITGETSIFILPGYEFKICKGLITNFHLPGSTLILLVAAFTGNDWRRIYTEAIMKDYRFLSYGDASLVIP